MDELISILNSMASIFMFFCMIFIFGKLTNENKKIYVIGEILFASVIVLLKVTIIYLKGYMSEETGTDYLEAIICFVYAIINVRNLTFLIEREKRLKSKKGQKFDKRA